MKTTKNHSSFSEKFFTNDCFCNKEGLSIYINDLLREKDLIPSDIYGRAGLSRQVWSKYRSGQNIPKPEQARRLLIGLKCTPEEAKVLLSYCGMSFTSGNVYDECFLHCLKNHVYNMVDVSIYILNHVSQQAA